MNCSAATDFPSLCVEYIPISVFSSHDFINLLKNSLPLSTHSLFGLWLDSFKFFWKALVIGIPFLFFKGITHAYLLFHNKNLNCLLDLLINCISARSAPQILSIKGDRTLLFSNFLKTALCNSSANCFFEIFSFSIPLADVFYKKPYKPLE